MSEKTGARAFTKKSSLNSDSTTFNSSASSASKVIQVQKISSTRLVDHLYD
jgi:hypothetical protein